jgi:phosphoglycerate kinase
MGSIKSKNIFNKRVLMRVDFNVPVKNGNILDDFRMQQVLPTIRFLREKKVKKIILISHLGQPDVKDRNKSEFSLEPIANHLEKLIKGKIYFITTLIGKDLQDEIENLPDGSIILLENIRFYKGENKNDRSFAKELAKIADIFINEAFSVCHRKIASLCAITEFLPSYAGLLLEKELISLNKIIKKPLHPLVLILGGAKIKDKISVIEKFNDNADCMLLGGIMANTFLKVNDFCIGKSFYDKEALAQAEDLKIGKTELILPGDFVVLDKNNKKKIKELGKITKDDKIFDIGPIACNAFSKIISKAKTVFFNGPMGKFEDKRFIDGTNKVITAIVKNKKAFSIIGGGETVASLKTLNSRFQTTNSIFLSTGGGAMLKYLAGESLPGLTALNY